MKKFINILKAFIFMDTAKWLGFAGSMIIAVIISVNIYSQTTDMVLNYVNRGTTIWIRDLFGQLLLLIFFSYQYIDDIEGTRIKSGKIIGTMNNFLIQAPVLKKDILNIKFAIFQVANIPLFIVVLHFLLLNIYISKADFISAYSGFFVLIYCLWTINLSISIGSSYLSAKKYKATWYLSIALYVVLILSCIYMQYIPLIRSGSIVNDKNMYSGLGPMLIPLLRVCTRFGGSVGVIVMLFSSLISYFFSYKLPLKILEKVGN